MEVRRATAADAEAIAGVHVRTWQVAYAHVFPEERLAGLSISDRVTRWREGLAAGEADVFVAVRDGAVVGFGVGGPSRDEDGAGLGELYGLYVDPAAWGTGAGAALAAAVDEALRGHGFGEATLWVLDDNPRARRFYAAAGWAEDRTTRAGEHLGVSTAELRYRKRL